jgi:hypothetical protein
MANSTEEVNAVLKVNLIQQVVPIVSLKVNQIQLSTLHATTAVLMK